MTETYLDQDKVEEYAAQCVQPNSSTHATFAESAVGLANAHLVADRLRELGFDGAHVFYEEDYPYLGPAYVVWPTAPSESS